MAIYVAGPLFNTHERWYLEQIAAALEAQGYRTYLPHRDSGVLVDTLDGAVRRRLFAFDLAALDRCDCCVALLTGQDHDSGTSAEIGYLYASGKRCYGITDDLRGRVNNMIWGFCDEGRRIVADIDNLLEMLAADRAGR